MWGERAVVSLAKLVAYYVFCKLYFIILILFLYHYFYLYSVDKCAL